MIPHGCPAGHFSILEKQANYISANSFLKVEWLMT